MLKHSFSYWYLWTHILMKDNTNCFYHGVIVLNESFVWKIRDLLEHKITGLSPPTG